MQERFLASTLGARAHDFCLHSVYSGLRGDDLCLCLIDSGECALNPAVLKLALPVIVLDGSFRSLYRCGGLIQLGLEIVIVQLDDQLSLAHLLIIGDLHVPHDACNLCAQRSQIAAYIGIVCDLFNPSALPARSSHV